MFVTKWGNWGSGDGELWNPINVSVGSDESVYVPDSSNSRIQRFTSEGVFLSQFGTWGASNQKFIYPYGVAAASDGTVYVSDATMNRIQRFAPDP